MACARRANAHAMLRQFYDRMIALAARPRAAWWLAAVAFAESSFFPVPPDLMLIPMVLARPKRAWHYATICTLASVAGGALGWLIGAELYAYIARPLIDFYHYDTAFAAFQQRFAQYGLWVILVKGLTPIPYKVISIAAGAARFDLPTFLLASLATRGLRFFLVAGLLRIFGEPLRHFIEKRLTLVTTIFAVLIVLGFVALKYI